MRSRFKRGHELHCGTLSDDWCGQAILTIIRATVALFQGKETGTFELPPALEPGGLPQLRHRQGF